MRSGGGSTSGNDCERLRAKLEIAKQQQSKFNIPNKKEIAKIEQRMTIANCKTNTVPKRAPKGSDARLKTDITLIGQSPSGIPTYKFRYLADPDKVHVGTMAQDLILMGLHDAIVMRDDGMMMVNYDLLDVESYEI
jgi:hypothetical protein